MAQNWTCPLAELDAREALTPQGKRSTWPGSAPAKRRGRSIAASFLDAHSPAWHHATRVLSRRRTVAVWIYSVPMQVIHRRPEESR